MQSNDRLGSGVKNIKKNIANPLEEEISEREISVHKGGGFFVIKDIKYAANVHVDIWIMVGSVDSMGMQKMLREYNGLTYKARQYKDTLKFLDLKHYLDGYGRIVFFTSNDPELRPEQKTLIKVQEGRFENGLPNGYCRIMNATGEGSVEMGYFFENQPTDRYIKLKLDGEII